ALQNLFPWLDFSAAQWASFRIDRAEPYQASGQLPDGVFVHSSENKIIAWPTKLVLAPQLANEILALLKKNAVYPAEASVKASTPSYVASKAMIARPMWDQAHHWLSSTACSIST
ncbi:MAG: hypothetical protein ACNA7Y_04990, partial [Gammaproteobacteria bacterium]